MPISDRYVIESNKRGAFHIHGQFHGGLTPNLFADCAEDEALLALILEELDTQVQAEMPLTYHLVEIARHVLFVGARRDAAADIPRPKHALLKNKAPIGQTQVSWDIERRQKLEEEWWPQFTCHAMLVVSNRNVHDHLGSCLSGKRGTTGCRFNAPWPHDVEKTRCHELFINDTDESSTTDVMVRTNIEFRSRYCHGDGAMRDTTMPQETRACKIAEADHRRDLFYTAANPTPHADVGDDVRVLHVELMRRPLTLLRTIKEALEKEEVLDKKEYMEGLRRTLRDTITLNEELANFLAAPELRVIHDRLMELSEQLPDGDGDNKVVSKPTSVSFLLPFVRNSNLLYHSHNCISHSHSSILHTNKSLQDLWSYSKNGLTRPWYAEMAA
jgi:hypothetical protein